MELGPTPTNDQDDNERPARYLECQPGSKAGKWYRQHGHEANKKGGSVCHVVLIFQHNRSIGLMKRTLNNVCRAILTRDSRDPPKSDNAEKPWFF